MMLTCEQHAGVSGNFIVLQLNPAKLSSKVCKPHPYVSVCHASTGYLHQALHVLCIARQRYRLMQVVFEPAAPVGATPPKDTGAEQPPSFPHLYGTIDYESVEKELLVERDASSGRFLSIKF